MLLRIKENKAFDKDTMTSLEALVNKEVREKTEQVVEEYDFNEREEDSDDDDDDDNDKPKKEKDGLTMRQFEAWMEMYESEPFVEK